MKKRFRDTSKFDKSWYMNLSPRLKCAVDFLHDKCDNSGVWEPNYNLLNMAVNDRKKITESEILTVDAGKQFAKLNSGKIFCLGFIEFQCGELNHKCKPHLQIFGLLKKHGIELENFKGYAKGIDRVQEKETDKEREKEREEEKEEEKHVKIFGQKIIYNPEEILQKLKSNFQWVEKCCRLFGLSVEEVEKMIDKFILEQDTKTNLSRSLAELSEHFVSWAKKPENQVEKNKSTGNNKEFSKVKVAL